MNLMEDNADTILANSKTILDGYLMYPNTDAWLQAIPSDQKSGP